MEASADGRQDAAGKLVQTEEEEEEEAAAESSSTEQPTQEAEVCPLNHRSCGPATGSTFPVSASRSSRSSSSIPCWRSTKPSWRR